MTPQPGGDQPTTLAAILAGGQGQRMGGRDKGLLDWQGRPLVAHVLSRLEPQGLPIVINANRNRASYARYGLPVIADLTAEQVGPLGGMLAVMQAVFADYYLFVPCDAPLLPMDLYARFWQARTATSMAVCARDDERLHPTFVLLSNEAKSPLTDYLAAGGRRVRDFLESVGLVTVSWTEEGQRTFHNINHPGDLDPVEPTPPTAEDRSSS